MRLALVMNDIVLMNDFFCFIQAWHNVEYARQVIFTDKTILKWRVSSAIDLN